MKIERNTDLYGVVGMPLEHTLSPAMHNAAFEECGLNAVYKAFESTNLGGTIQCARAMDIKGLSVTIPYKSSIIPYLDRIDTLAVRIGAVNTVVNERGLLAGYNTDAAGALKALQEAIDPGGKHAVILGSGGAARAIGYVLKEHGSRLTIVSRSRKHGEELARRLDASYAPFGGIRETQVDIIINATPLGMYPNEESCPLDPGEVGAEVVMDIVYNPLETKLIRLAKAHGCTTVPGIKMFVFQGAEQFRLWTGLQAPIRVMEDAVREALTQQIIARTK